MPKLIKRRLLIEKNNHKYRTIDLREHYDRLTIELHMSYYVKSFYMSYYGFCMGTLQENEINNQVVGAGINNGLGIDLKHIL